MLLGIGLGISASFALGQGILEAAVLSLFSVGEQGAWYDPSDFSTLFQDETGTTPVTAVGQPVGLMLDKRLGLGLGAELVSTVTSLNGATLSSNTVFPITVTATATGNQGLLRLAVPQGKSYQLSFSWSGNNTGQAIQANVGSTYFSVGTAVSGSYTTIRYADIAGNVNIYINATAIGQSFVVESFSIKEIAGNHATQATAANRPVLQQDAGGHYYLAFNGTNSSMASATGGGGNTGFFFCASVMPTGGAGTFRILFSDIGANTGYNVRVGVTDKLVEGAGNGTAFTTISTVASLNVGTISDVTAWDDGINLNAQIDAFAIASTARPLVVAGPGSFTLGKENGSASGFFPGNFYGVIYVNNSGLTASQRTAAQAWVKSKAGL